MRRIAILLGCAVALLATASDAEAGLRRSRCGGCSDPCATYGCGGTTVHGSTVTTSVRIAQRHLSQGASLDRPVRQTVDVLDAQLGIAAAHPIDRAKLSAELQRIQATAEFRDQLRKFGMEPSPPQSPAEFAAILAAEQPRWAKAVKDSGAKVD